MKVFSITAILAWTMLLSAPGLAQGAEQGGKAAIDGWGKLKFGMSVQQAVAAMPDLNLKSEACTTQIARNGCHVAFPLTKPVSINGLDLMLTDMKFDRYNRLSVVILKLFEDSKEPNPVVRHGRCEEYYLRLLHPLEKKYGAFVSVIKNEKGSDYFTLKSTTNKQASDRYNQSLMGSPAITYGPHIQLEAYAPSATCALTLIYASNPPAPEAAPENTVNAEDLL